MHKLLIVSILALLQPGVYGQNTAPSAPNIVLIVADDMGYADVSFNKGNIPTPRLDQLAADGIRFTDFHTSGAVCSPSRAGLITGLYQYRVGVPEVIAAMKENTEHDRGLDSNAYTLPALLRERGYITGLFGKWHLGYADDYNPLHYGFDQFRGYLSGQIDYHSHIDLAGSFDWWNGLQKTKDSGYSTHLITEQAIRFIKENSQRPFFVMIAHQAVHNPYQGPDDKAFRKEGLSAGEVPPDQQTRSRAETFRIMLEELDKGVGAVRQTLRDLNIENNTLIVFLSDNGGVVSVSSNAPFRGGKGTVFEGGHRVPAAICWPGKINPGATCSDLVSSLDIMPTLLSITHSATPKDYHPDGLDLGRLLFNGQKPANRMLFWNNESGKFVAGVRYQQWKLVETKEGDTLLFNLALNPAENRNVAAQHPAIVADMLQAYRKWKSDVGVSKYYSNQNNQ